MYHYISVIILIFLFSLKSGYSQKINWSEQTSVKKLEKRIQSLVRKSKSPCLHEYDNIIHVFWGQVVQSSSIEGSIEPEVFTAGCLLNKQDYYRAESYLMLEEELLGICDGRVVYKNCGYEDQYPYRDSKNLLHFIKNNKLTLVFQMTGLSIGSYYAIDHEGEALFFKCDKGSCQETSAFF